MLPWPPVRAQPDTIPAPPFPRELPWINVAPLRMDKQRGRPVLIEFWDFCRVNSLRTMPYLKAWHERYADLRVIGVHAGGFLPGARRGQRPPRGRAARGAVPGRDRRAARAVGPVRQRGLARALPVGHARRAVLDALRRGRLRGDRARDPGAARDRAGPASRRCARRTSRACCCPPRPRTSRAPTAGRTRRAACGRCSRARARWSRATARSPCPSPAASSSSRTRTTRPAVLDLRVGAGRHVPRHLLHPGCRSSA